MTYLDYVVQFEKLDQAQAFSGNATRLYLKLLALANAIGWPDEFAKSDAYVAAVCGFAENTMKDCRTKLVARGLLATTAGKMGRGSMTTYQLLAIETLNNKASNSDTLQANKVSEFDTLTSEKASESDTIPYETGNKASDKVSNFDALYIDKENNTSSAAVAASAGALSSASEGLDSQPASAPTVGPAPAEATTTLPLAGRAPRKRGAALPTGPAELLPASCLLAELLNPGGLAARVQQMAEPLTLAQAEWLLLDFSTPVLREIFCEMANYRKLLTASTSANLTARNWLTRRGLKPSTQQPPLLIATTTSAAEEELDDAARQFRAEQAAREQAEQDAHFARWAARPTATA
jgi:hypothetical protein